MRATCDMTNQNVHERIPLTKSGASRVESSFGSYEPLSLTGIQCAKPLLLPLSDRLNCTFHCPAVHVFRLNDASIRICITSDCTDRRFASQARPRSPDRLGFSAVSPQICSLRNPPHDRIAEPRFASLPRGFMAGRSNVDIIFITHFKSLPWSLHKHHTRHNRLH